MAARVPARARIPVQRPARRVRRAWAGSAAALAEAVPAALVAALAAAGPAALAAGPAVAGPAAVVRAVAASAEAGDAPLRYILIGVLQRKEVCWV